MADELKSFFAQEISVDAVNVTTSINNTMNRINTLNEIDTRVNETKTLTENNTNRLEQLEEERKITNLRLEEYCRKIEQLEELVDDQINWNACSTLIICGVKFNLRNEELEWHQKFLGNHSLHTVQLEQRPVCTWYRTGTSQKLQESKFPDLC